MNYYHQFYISEIILQESNIFQDKIVNLTKQRLFGFGLRSSILLSILTFTCISCKGFYVIAKNAFLHSIDYSSPCLLVLLNKELLILMLKNNFACL